MLIERLQIRLGELKDLFTPEELQEFLSTAQATHELIEGEDDLLILDLALSACYLRLATDTATYFKYTQADETVDKSMTPEIFLKLYETLKQSCDSRLGKPTTFILRKNAPGKKCDD